jgi:hypothetical protein
MEVVSGGNLPVASLRWQPRAGTWVFTVVCRATYRLRPRECPGAEVHELPADDDRFFDNEPAGSVCYPRDLVPAKPAADVFVVGHAFAPGRQAVRAMEARLVVGEIDKTIEVVADRVLRPDGSARRRALHDDAPALRAHGRRSRDEQPRRDAARGA